ncbi:hypothetical protein VNI00_019089, partial [Paramarasmius palmivorus]
CILPVQDLSDDEGSAWNNDSAHAEDWDCSDEDFGNMDTGDAEDWEHDNEEFGTMDTGEQDDETVYADDWKVRPCN